MVQHGGGIMLTKPTTWIVAALLGLGVTANAVAVTVYTEYTDRVAFEAALATSTTEDFESPSYDPYLITPDPSFNIPNGLTNLTPPPLMYFSLVADLAVPADPADRKVIKIWDALHEGSHNTTAGGKKFLYLDTDIGLIGSETDFLLNSQVDAFGFDYTGVFEFGTAFTVTIGSDIFNLSLNNPEATPLFWGVIGSAKFSTVTLFTDLDSGYGVDDVTFGFAIPLPPAIWLFGSGLLALAGSSMKRRMRS